MGNNAANAARFKVGDQVIYVGPGSRAGEPGEVVALGQGFDSIYRYDVRFSDGTGPERFFSHELELHRVDTENAA